MCKYTWDQIRNQVKSFRARTQTSYPYHALVIIKDFYIDANRRKIYFLSNNQFLDGILTRHLNLYEVNYDNVDSSTIRTRSSTPPSPVCRKDQQYMALISQYPVLEWAPVFTHYLAAAAADDRSHDDTTEHVETEGGTRSSTHSIQGVSQYQVLDDKILFSFAGAVFLGAQGHVPSLIPFFEHRVPHNPPIVVMPNSGSESPPSPPEIMDGTPTAKQQGTYAHRRRNGSGSSHRHPVRADPKLGGVNNNLVAFIRNRDIWVATPEGYEVQLTTSSQHSTDPTMTSGTAEYVMQEEFQRYTGYYWAPSSRRPLNRIVYLETSEKDVDIAVIAKPASGAIAQSNASNVEPVRYPQAGKANAISDLQVVEFGPVIPEQETSIVTKRLWGGTIQDLFPWCEYIVRFGWLPDGESVWAQILSRDQKRTAVLQISYHQFLAEIEHDPYRQERTDIKILWEETSSTWVNVSDAFYFLKSSTGDSVDFIWSSEKTGFRHLYYVSRRPSMEATVTQLTSGDWSLMDHPLYVDERRKLVYFMAKNDTPLEAHLYVTLYEHTSKKSTHNHNHNYHHVRPMARLTRLGHSHNISMNAEAGIFVDSFSSLHHIQTVVVQRLQYHGLNELPTVVDRDALLLFPQGNLDDEADSCESEFPPSNQVLVSPSEHKRASSRISSSAPGSDGRRVSDGYEYWQALKASTCDMYDPTTHSVPAGEIFSFLNSDNVRLYGYLYKPRYYEPGTSYPTILYIYGGPKTQMVTNDFRLPRLQRYLMSVHFGFAVVVIDGRGSSDRGLHFEAHIKNRLGMVEIQDQIEGLQYIHDAKVGAEATVDGHVASVIDLERVGITGWSYGGYLSLMGLAQHGDKFKVAIAGAPVTQWELYDSAYTERYMGLPSENQEGYRMSSVINWADNFPNRYGRRIL
ncbi:dipeptidyl peptidase IV N-terminal region-domain-containing protein [Dichotomocladium elegans]|nr:dipeptidyl peptidase IV N-terminal region-domain-containing protein [Dichotomocladium elegans]